MRLYMAFVALVGAGVCAFAASPEPTTAAEAIRQHLLLVAVRPDYPYEARRNLLTGTGVFELKFDYESGNLREVHVVQSTGQRILDAHAIGALKLWKAKPRSLHTIRANVSFTYGRA
jgi:TonB family protein